MKRIFAFLLALTFFVFSSSYALAGYGDRSEQELYGSKVPIAKYWVGQCLQSDKEMIQQLSDGTFALPGDSLYTCNKRGLANNWTDDPSLNPWGTNSGTGMNFPYLPTATNSYPWGTNYPGGFNSYNDWLLYCVVGGTLIMSQECMSYPRTWPNGVPSYDNPLSPYGSTGYNGYGYGGSNYGGYSGYGGGYGGYGGYTGLGGAYGGSGYAISIDGSNGNSNVSYTRWGDYNTKDLLKTFLIGWGVNWLLNKIS